MRFQSFDYAPFSSALRSIPLGQEWAAPKKSLLPLLERATLF